MQGQRGQRVDAPKAPQPRDGWPQPLVLGEPREALLERVAAGEQPVEGGGQGDEDQLGRLVREGLARQPLAGGGRSPGGAAKKGAPRPAQPWGAGGGGAPPRAG